MRSGSKEAVRRKVKKGRLPGELPPLGDPERRAEKRRKRQARQGGRPQRGVYRAITILLICAVAMTVWVNRENLRPENISEWVQTQMMGLETGSGYPVYLNSESVTARNFLASGTDVVFASDTAVHAYNSSAKSLFSRKHSFSVPIMKVSGQRLLIYNLGGSGYRLESRPKTLLSAATDGKLLGGAVCDNGRFALLTQQDGYCGKLTVYQQNGQVAFQYSFSEYYPTAVAMDASGTHAAVAAVSAKGGALTSAVYQLDFNSNTTLKPIASYTDAALLDISYTEDGGLLAVGDTMTAALDTTGKERGCYHYGDAELNTWNLQGGTAVLGLAKFHNATSGMLTAVGSDGKALGTAALSAVADSVTRSGSVMAALCDGQVRAFSTNGQAAGSCTVGQNARAVALRSNSQIYILDVSEIRLENLKN